jgi:hypothetical protein
MNSSSRAITKNATPKIMTVVVMDRQILAQEEGDIKSVEQNDILTTHDFIEILFCSLNLHSFHDLPHNM